MNSYLQDLLINKDKAGVDKYLNRLIKNKHWTLISLIDELLPGLLFESNLTYGSFHQVKMALFLRRLSINNILSKETEEGVARVILTEMLNRNWLNIEAGDFKGADRIDQPLDNMVEELNKGNIHNSYYYAIQEYKDNPANLSEYLLGIGSLGIPDSLGHSLSCFQPVIEDLVFPHHQYAETALLSYVTYLGRRNIPEDFDPEDYSLKEEPDWTELLKKAASGSGIINLHHMITSYIYLAWKDSDYHQGDYKLPFKILVDWFKDKKVDQTRLERVENLEVSTWLPSDYAGFYDAFDYDNPDETARMVINLAEAKYSRLYDWMVRLYADDYDQPRWNPHFYTGLYSALSLYGMEDIDELVVLRMALDQAVRYYINGMKN
ncbi:hypothetical protein I0Q91_01715 [Halanaerobiaceae bacterium Z-7014]|uniref:Uncharacterized protein n=1 Tax=Halonatronomonas betaini TaxID=2778430 RepID=A0A931ASQ9_9FIRM|nr:hypothetical protein [Halonatronomonas betaini]MBF8435785.1 hypothetical protein [Halonatronomonas betaini]